MSQKETSPTAQKRWVLWGCVLAVLLGSAFKPPVEPVMTIVIDAGHGGKDPGNLGTGRYEIVEKDITLAVALKTAKYIEDRIPDVKVILTRSGDSYPTLQDRVRIANNARADLLLSIHCDSFTKPTAVGSSSFVMGLSKSEASLRVAAKENAAIFEGSNAEGFNPEDPDTFIALALKQEIYLGRSLQLAELIQTQFRERVGRTDRGVRQAPYYVTAYASMPSVLVELGFLTNPDEEDFLHSEQGQDYMASALFRAFRDYAQQWASLEATIQSAPGSPSSGSGTTATSDPHDSPEEASSPAWMSGLTAACDQTVCYSVQAASRPSAVALQTDDGWDIPHVTRQQVGNVYKYRVGSTPDYKAACQMRDTLRVHGFPDAFVVAFAVGKRIPLAEALTRQRN